MKNHNENLTSREFAAIMRVHPKTVLRWIKEDQRRPEHQRRFPLIRVGRGWLFPRWFVEKLVGRLGVGGPRA